VIKRILESGLAVYAAAGSVLIHVKKIVSVPVVILSVKENGIGDNVTAGSDAEGLQDRTLIRFLPPEFMPTQKTSELLYLGISQLILSIVTQEKI